MLSHLESKAKAKIFAKYPHATRADQGVKAGDLLVNSINVPALLVTKEMLTRPYELFGADLHYFYVIGTVGEHHPATEL